MKRATLWSAAGVLLALVVTWRLGTQHWLAVHTGSSNTPGTPPNYNFFSGFGSDLGEFTIVGAVVTFVVGAWRHVNCHEPGCPWIGRHKVDGTPWCNKHHEAARTRSGAAR